MVLLNVLFIQMIIERFEACYHFHEILKLGFVVRPGYLHGAKRVKLVDIVFWSYSLFDLNIYWPASQHHL